MKGRMKTAGIRAHSHKSQTFKKILKNLKNLLSIGNAENLEVTTNNSERKEKEG